LPVSLEIPRLTLDTGVMPTWAYGIGGGVDARLGPWRIALAGLVWLPQTNDAQARGAFGGTYRRYSGELAGCYAWTGGALEIAPCLALRLEVMTARGSGPQVVDTNGHGIWLAAGLGLRARWSIWPWTALFVRPGVDLATVRPSYTIGDVGSVYRPSLVSFGLDLGVEWPL
jgi:hypothetical protein